MPTITHDHKCGGAEIKNGEDASTIEPIPVGSQQLQQGESQQFEQEISALLEGSGAILRHREFKDAAWAIFDSCRKLIKATAGYVAMKNEAGTDNNLLFLYSGDQICTVDPSLPMPIRGLREKVYQTGQVEYDNTFAGSDWVRLLPSGHMTLDNVLFAPLMLDGKAFGLLGLANKPGGFTPNDSRMAAAFAGFAAIAFLNSSLFQSLEQSGERFRSVIQSAGDAIICTDSSGNISDFNSVASSMFGCKADEVIGQPCTILMPERLRQAHQDGIRRFIVTGKPTIIGKTVETMAIRKDGTEFPVELSLSTSRIGTGILFTAIMRDITARKIKDDKIYRENEKLEAMVRERTSELQKANDTLSESETTCRMLVENIPQKIFTKDRNSIYISCNDNFAHDLGITPEEFKGKNDYVFFSEEMADKYRADDRRIMESGEAESIEEQYIRDGQIFWVHTTKTPIRDEQGNITGILGIFSDITGRKQAEDELRQSEMRHRRFYESGLIGVIYWNMQGKITDANDKFLDMLGYTRDELEAGQIDWQNMTPPEFRYLDERSLVELKATGVNSKPFEKDYIHKDGHRIPIILAGAMLDNKCHNGVAFVLDISERKRAEEEHRQLEEQYRHAQKMEAVGRLAGGVVHDFNNMLGIIMGYSELILGNTKLEAPLREDMNEIAKAAKRSTNLTRQLLAFARKQEILPRVLDLNALIEESQKMLCRLLGAEIELKVIPGADLWLVKMDPSQVDQILANFAVNSRDAITGNGHMEIETSNMVLNQDFCTSYPDCTSGEYVVITFSDNGCGMDRPTQERIFEPFFTTKAEGRGTGLGLSTVYGIVKQNNGVIDVESSPGKGTTFRIYIPRTIPEVLENTESQSQVPAKNMHNGTETILVVEDEENILKLYLNILEQHGYEVITAAHPEEALMLCRQHDGDIHLLLTDVIMPEMNGKELSKWIEIVKPGIRTIFMSGYTADVIAHLGVLTDESMFIQKPFSPDKLLRKIRNALDSRGFIQ